MRRKLTLAMLLALSAASPQALALGIGEVDVLSSLNAPLRAVIPLTDTAGLDPELLRVSVAEPREFDSAGLVRTSLAASVRAEVEVRQGRWVVTLASERPVREPWMDLLLRFDWPSGRQLREVTLLLDPPDYDSMPLLVSGSSRRPESAARPSAATSEPASQASSRPVVTRRSQAQAEDRAWVGSGDTLWSMAGRLRPGNDISMNQMMVALVEANPDIFPSGNINAMRAGHALVVPSRETIAARTGAEADRIVQAMNQAWASRGSGAPARVSLGPSMLAGETIDVAAVSAAGEAAPAPPADQGEAETEVMPSAEGADALPRLTLLSDEELAAEAVPDVTEGDEEVSAALGGGALDGDVLAALGAGELTLRESDPRFALLERRWQESQAALEEVQAERDVLQQELGGLREEIDAMREQLALLAGGVEEGAGPGTVVVPSDAETQADAPWWGAAYPVSIDRNLILGGAGLAALLGLWLWVRRRQRRDAAALTGRTAMPNMIHGMPPTNDAAMPPSPTAPIPPMVAGMTVGEASPHPEEVPRAAMPQAEAISEVDIFMAYGRYDQARELLEAGLTRDPERHDLRLKLLGVYVEQGNRQAAEHEAQQLAETGDSALVAEAGRLLARHHPTPPSNDSLPGSDEPPPASVEPEGREVAESRVLAAGQDEALLGDEHERVDFPRAEHAGRGEEPLAEEALREESLRAEEPDEAQDELDEEVPGAGTSEQAPSAERSATVEWGMIDYQPPVLDPEPPSREETPMQPSIDFPPPNDGHGATQGDEPPERSRANSAEETEWEVEEVAFPPLDRDNGVALGNPDQSDDLEEARRLLEDGEVERARPLLQQLLGSDDPQLRDKTQHLITHYRL
ncbi:FimV/HubP family polar landmark protein [Billgrantia sp. Q4P2]|uniref:FimV/HubP family polar landmark protein n=1 Tax=Billgrantia sp. Q4P2 TaxID=3463857 RepID=UPI00405645E0